MKLSPDETLAVLDRVGRRAVAVAGLYDRVAISDQLDAWAREVGLPTATMMRESRARGETIANHLMDLLAAEELVDISVLFAGAWMSGVESGVELAREIERKKTEL